MPSVLKVIVFPSNETILSFKKRSTCCMIFITFRKLFCTLRVPLCKKYTHKILIVFAVKLLRLKPQSTTKALFREPTPAISHLLQLVLVSKKEEIP